MQNKGRFISAPYLDPYDYRSFIHGLFTLQFLTIFDSACSSSVFLLP
ncbi:hypothetical protein [Peribacillus frigoritolerans]